MLSVFVISIVTAECYIIYDINQLQTGRRDPYTKNGPR